MTLSQRMLFFSEKQFSVFNMGIYRANKKNDWNKKFISISATGVEVIFRLEIWMSP